MFQTIQYLIPLAIVFPSTAAWAFTSYPPPTLSETVAGNDFVASASVTRVSSKRDEKTVELRIEQILKCPGGDRINSELILTTYQSVKTGRCYLIYGTYERGVRKQKLSVGLVMNQRRLGYVRSAPSPEADRIDRLRFFIPRLEDADEAITRDARRECSEMLEKAPAALWQVADCIPVARIREALVSGKGAAQKSLYGVLLGVSGQARHRALLEGFIYDDLVTGFRTGLDGLIVGYLLLSGEDGLRRIEQSHMGASALPFAHSYAAMMAIRHLWKLKPERFTRARLTLSMRLMLDHPRMPDLAIMDLARWQDWTVLDRVVELTRTADEKDGVRRAVRVCAARYFDAAIEASTEDRAADANRIERAQAAYSALQELDPDAVKRYEKFFRLTARGTHKTE